MIQPSHPGTPRPAPPTPTPLVPGPAASTPLTPRFVPADPGALVHPTQGIQLNLRSRSARTRTPVQFTDSWSPPGVPRGRDPRPGQAVAGRFVINTRVRALGAATLYNAVDMDLGDDVLLLAEPEGAVGAGGGRRELRAAQGVRHLNLLRQLETGSWDGLRFSSFVAPPGEPLANMALPLGGRLPALHVATLAARSVAGLAAVHDDGRLLGGVYPGSVIVAPWGLQVWLVGWRRRAASERFADRASGELRSLGRVLLRLRGQRSSHPAEVELDELLELIVADNLRSGSMPGALVAHALTAVAQALQQG